MVSWRQTGVVCLGGGRPWVYDRVDYLPSLEQLSIEFHRRKMPDRWDFKKQILPKFDLLTLVSAFVCHGQYRDWREKNM